MPVYMDSYDWFDELYRRELKERFRRMRYTGGNNKRAARKARDAKLAADVRAGRTNGIFLRITGPKHVRIPANAIWVPVEGEDGAPGMELRTDQDGVLKGAHVMGYHTTSTAGPERANCRTDGTTEAELDAGDLPPRFDALDYAELKDPDVTGALPRPHSAGPPDGGVNRTPPPGGAALRQDRLRAGLLRAVVPPAGPQF